MGSLERCLVRILNHRPRRPATRATGLLVGRTRRLLGGVEEEGRFAVRPAQHTFVGGRTGSGKSTLLIRLMTAHLEARIPFLFIDFHGTTIDHILGALDRLPDPPPALLLEPWSDPVLGWNPLAVRNDSPHATVQQLVSVFHRRLYPDAWGPRLEELLRMTLLALAENGLTLLEVAPFLSVPEFRRRILQRVTLADVREFWMLRFERSSPSQKSLVSEAVLNKFSGFHDPILKYAIGQRPGSLDLARALANGQTVLVNLSVGQMRGQHYLLGALFVAHLLGAVYARPANARAYSIFLDEFQELVAMASLEDYLRSFRKFGCSVYLATQHLQGSPELKAAILGNCQRYCLFGSSAADAAVFGRECGPTEGPLVADMLPELPVGRAVLKVRGEPANLLQVIPPAAAPTVAAIARGRSRCLCSGERRTAIDADIADRTSSVRSTVDRALQIPPRKASPKTQLPEGYEPV